MSFDLSDLKEKYSVLVEKHGLPSFKEMNEVFEIEKIDRESDTLLRTVRKVIMDKVLNSLNFIEMLLNPVNAPRMYMVYVNGVNPEERKKLDKLYSGFGKMLVKSIQRELDYSEDEEAKLIKELYGTWNDLKEDFMAILKNVENPKVSEKKKERDYFG
jgi:hypothetical protein